MPLTAPPLRRQSPVHTEDLIALRTISNGGLAGGKLPTRLKLLNWGDNKTVMGVVTVGPETVASLAVNQAARGYDRVALDFDHQTVPGSDTYQKDPVKVAAYGTPSVIPGDGLYLENIQWTPAGQEFAPNYHDLSPTVKLNASREVTFIHSAALCRQGAVEDLHFYNVPLKPLSTPTPMPDPAATSTDQPDFRALLISLLGGLGIDVPDGASDSDIATAVQQFKAPAVPAKKPDAAAPAAGKGDASTDDVQAMHARMDRLEKSRDDEAKGALIALATSEGKVIPLSAAQIAATPIDILRTLATKLPAGTVPLHSRGTAAPGAQVSGGGLLALSADEQAICKNLGIAPEKYAKEKGTASTTVV
jgi:phage I-like protein